MTYIEEAKDKEIAFAVERKIEHLATKEEIAKQFGDAKADNIKWMFIFWLGQVGVIAAIIFAILKK